MLQAAVRGVSSRLPSPLKDDARSFERWKLFIDSRRLPGIDFDRRELAEMTRENSRRRNVRVASPVRIGFSDGCFRTVYHKVFSSWASIPVVGEAAFKMRDGSLKFDERTDSAVSALCSMLSLFYKPFPTAVEALMNANYALNNASGQHKMLRKIRHACEIGDVEQIVEYLAFSRHSKRLVELMVVAQQSIDWAIQLKKENAARFAARYCGLAGRVHELLAHACFQRGVLVVGFCFDAVYFHSHPVIVASQTANMRLRAIHAPSDVDVKTFAAHRTAAASHQILWTHVDAEVMHAAFRWFEPRTAVKLASEWHAEQMRDAELIGLQVADSPEELTVRPILRA